MFKLFLRVLAAFLLLIGLFLLIGSLIPRGYDIQSSVLIDAPPEEVFPHVNELRNWEKWSPVSESRIDGLRVQYSGEPKGVGAIQTWTESRGDGKMWISESDENRRIEYHWRFANFPDMIGEFQFDGIEKDRCQVTWRSKGTLPSGPFYGYFGIIFGPAMTNEYSKCLFLLKEELESPGEKPAGTGSGDENETAPESSEQPASTD